MSKYKVGDMIERTKGGNFTDLGMTIGNIYKIVEIDDNWVKVTPSSGLHWWEQGNFILAKNLIIKNIIKDLNN